MQNIECVGMHDFAQLVLKQDVSALSEWSGQSATASDWKARERESLYTCTLPSQTPLYYCL